MAGEPDFDVGIIGGGPAGSATAAYLAQAGASCVVSVYYRLNVLFHRLRPVTPLPPRRHRAAAGRRLRRRRPVLTKMKEAVSAVENNPGHVWHDLLGDLTSNAFAPAPAA